MVEGLETFTKYFKGYEDCYILIGGTACDLWIENAGGEFRKTKDLDVIVVAGNVTVEFVKRLWAFYAEGGYTLAQKKSGDPAFFRFKNPKKGDFPYIVELFSRQDLESLVSADKRFTVIKTDKHVSSLSAILMDAEYYNLVITSRVSDDHLGIPVSPPPTLIALKMKAYLDLSERKEKGEEIDSDDIKKHRNDVFRLLATLKEDDRILLTDGIQFDGKTFIEKMGKLSAEEFKSIGQAVRNKGLNRTTQLARLEKLLGIET